MLTHFPSLAAMQTPHEHHQRARSRSHRSRLSSSKVTLRNGSNSDLQVNASYPTTPLSSPLDIVQCSAYFLRRLDLNDYTMSTLKYTVDTIVSQTLSKGLKVKLSLPDDGFIVENLADANQSWMYRRDELLYFWRDPFHSKIVVIISTNRLSYYTTAPYSASLFRLRGHDSAQLFIQRAQEFFALLSAPTKRANASLERSSTADSRRAESKRSKDHKRKKSKSSVMVNEPAAKKSSRSSQPVPIRLITRTEFDPGQRSTGDSIASVYNRRTYSDTTVSSDSASKTNHQADPGEDDEDGMTNNSTRFSLDYVAELVHELKELRNEIASLKLESRTTPVRSTSTSPLILPPSQDTHEDMDAETQTDHTLFNHRRQQQAKKSKALVSNRSETQSSTNKRKSERTSVVVIKRPASNGTMLDSPSQVNGEHALDSPAPHQRVVFSAPQTSLGLGNGTNSSQPNGTVYNPTPRRFPSHSQEEEAQPMAQDPSVPMKEERSNFHSTHNSSLAEPNTKATVSFRSELEDPLDPSEHIYENVPILIRTNSNQANYYNIPIIKGNNPASSNGYMYVTINDDQMAKVPEQQYRAQFTSEQNGLPVAPIPSPETDYPRIPPQVYFADHLTNPLFNVDKQLLTNTIANQFGIDLQSPYLPQLINNQHLFVAQKRTYANMVWQLSADEMRNLCSSPISSKPHSMPVDVDASTNGTTKSILRSQKPFSAFSKRQHITWNATVE